MVFQFIKDNAKMNETDEFQFEDWLYALEYMENEDNEFYEGNENMEGW